MQRYQDGGNSQQEQVLQQIAQYIQQAVQQGQTPEQIAADLIGQQIPPQIIGQMFVQMGMPEEQAAAALQTAMQGNSAQGMAAGQQQQQGPAEEAMEQGPAQQNPEEESMETPMQMYGGMYKVGGQQGNPGVYSDGYSGTSTGGQYFANGGAYGGVSPYMYNDAYSYMAMGGMIPRAQYGMEIPPRPQPDDYPDYGSFKMADDDWFSKYGDDANMALEQVRRMSDAAGAGGYASTGDLGYENPALAMAANLAAAPVTAVTPTSNNTYTGVSVVDMLNSMGMPSSFGARKELANQLGIPNYRGTAEQNAQLIQLVQQAAATSVANSKTANNVPLSTLLSTPLSFTPATAASAPILSGTPVVSPTKKRKAKSVVAAAAPTVSSVTPDNTFYPGVSALPPFSMQNIQRYNPLMSYDPLRNNPTGAALDYVSNLNQAVNANPQNYNIGNDSIPTVSLNAPDSLGAAPTDGSQQAVLDSILNADAKKYYNEAAKPDTINYGDANTYTPQLTEEEKQKLADEHSRLIRKYIAYGVGAPAAFLGTREAYRVYRDYRNIGKFQSTTKKTVERNINKMNAEQAAKEALDGETLNEVFKNFDSPENVLERAKARGYYTTEEKAILDGITNKKTKAQIAKLKYNKDIDPKIQKSQDMMRELWKTTEDKQFLKSDLDAYSAWLEQNAQQADEILQGIKSRGYKTAADIKKLKDLVNDPTATLEMLQQIKDVPAASATQARLQAIGNKLGDIAKQAGEIKTNLKASIKKPFTAKYNFVPGEGLEGTKAWATLNRLGNVADLSVNAVEVDEARYVLQNKDKFPKNAIAQAEATLEKSQMNPEFENIVDAYTKQTGSAPASNTEIVDQYHRDLEAGTRTPLVEAMETETGISSVKQRAGMLGDTYRGIKAKGKVGLDAIKRSTQNFKNVFNVSTPGIDETLSKIPETITYVEPNEISRPIELSPTVTGTKAKPKVEAAKTSLLDRLLASKKNIPAPVETGKPKVDVEGKIGEAESFLPKFRRVLGRAIRTAGEIKKEYGGPIDNGPYVPDYGMAYGGDIPEAMYGMGFAEGGQMPQWLAERRFKAAGNEHMMSDYGYAYGGGYYADGGEPCPGRGQIRNEQGTCVCGPGYDTDEMSGECIPLTGSSGSTTLSTTPGGMNVGTTGSQPLSLGFNIGQDKNFNISGGYRGEINQNRLGNSAYNLAFSFPRIFGKDRGLTLTGDYGRGNLRLGVDTKFPFFGGTLGVKGGYSQNLSNPSSEDVSNFMSTQPRRNRPDVNAGVEWNKKIGKTNLKISGSYGRQKEGGININPANKGKFTASAKAAGMGVQEFASKVLANKDKYSATQIKRANFARNAAKWQHADGGIVEVPHDQLDQTIQYLQNGGYQFQIMR